MPWIRRTATTVSCRSKSASGTGSPRPAARRQYCQGANPAGFDDLIAVLSEFHLTLHRLTDPGGSKGESAKTLDLAFRERGLREGHTTETRTT